MRRSVGLVKRLRLARLFKVACANSACFFVLWYSRVCNCWRFCKISTATGTASSAAAVGVELENTKETALVSVLGNVRTKSFYVGTHISFTLNDGSVIIGWSSGGFVNSQADLFVDLKPGGDLPELEAVITGISPIPCKEKKIYRGHHLTHTQKKNKYYEWSIYVPDKEALPRDTIMAYEVVLRFNADKSRFRGNFVTSLSYDLAINTKEDFQNWVLGAMAELSDNGIAPKEISYESVMQLAKKIRQSH